MLIARAPDPIVNGPLYQTKQAAFQGMVFNPDEDFLLPTPPLTPEDLHLTHDPYYVQAVLEGQRYNGFGNTDPNVLAHVLESNAALVAAAYAAVTRPDKVACAPASGFHHAGFARSGAYCTFNGLVIAARMLRRDGLARRVLIIDGDGHYGDGTQELINHYQARGEPPGLLAQVSLARSTVEGPRAAQRLLERALAAAPRPDLVLYQAGADAHIDDPYGAGYLTDADWVERDLLVFNWAKTHGVPLAWCLAGGYNGLKTLNLHNRTWLAALQVYAPESARLTPAPILL